jgi:hypothetical protein
MEFNRFKHHMYDIGKNRWVTLRAYYVHFNTGEASNNISLQLPVSDCENIWTLLPTLTYHHDLSIVPGPSFTLKLKWLKWDVLTIRWVRTWKDTEDDIDEPETAGPQSDSVHDFETADQNHQPTQ